MSHTPQKTTKILIVEDEAITAMDLALELEGLGYEVCGAEDNAEDAIETAIREKPDLILMDIRLGDGPDGIYAAEQISKHYDAVVIFLSAHSDEKTLARALSQSPYAYIVKPFRARELKLTIEVALQKHADGLAQNATIKSLALTDPLTGLGNRRYFDQFIDDEWNQAIRDQDALSTLMIDIDHFKAYNDSYGHAAGDTCLKAIGEALSKTCSRPGDKVFRWGGEEFAVVLTSTNLDGAARVARNLLEAVSNLQIPHAKSATASHVTISLGVASVIPTAQSAWKSLLEKADKALYSAKISGRNRFVEARD